MSGKTKKLLVGIGALGAVGLGGSALASGQDSGEQQVTGPQADQAKGAALRAVVNGKVTGVSTNAAERPDPSEKSDLSDTSGPAYQASIAWAVEVAKSDGGAVVVHLDKYFKVLGTEITDHQSD